MKVYTLNSHLIWATNIEIGQKVEIFSVIGNIGGALSALGNTSFIYK
jgi:hypothetical protein